MQTFLPFTTFTASATFLDDRRLQKQLVEGRQLWDIIHHPTTSHATTAQRNHPARNYFPPEQKANFASYLLIMFNEWHRRNPLATPHKSLYYILPELTDVEEFSPNPRHWCPLAYFIALSHRHALHSKAPDFYKLPVCDEFSNPLPLFINYIWLDADGKPYTGQKSRLRSVRYLSTNTSETFLEWCEDTRRRYALHLTCK